MWILTCHNLITGTQLSGVLVCANEPLARKVADKINENPADPDTYYTVAFYKEVT